MKQRMFAALLLLAACLGAAATERPFVLNRSAVQDEDDYRVFELFTGVERAGRARAFTTELQYSLEPAFEIELGWSRELAHDEDGGRATEVEFEARRVLRNPARHPIGFGVEIEIEAGRATEESERTGWRFERALAMFPLSTQWGLPRGSWLHATPGFERRRGKSMKPLLAVGAQGFVARRAELFAEWAAVRGGEALVQGGVRWWIRRDRIALDFAIGSRRLDDEHGSEAARVRTYAIGLSLLDL